MKRLFPPILFYLFILTNCQNPIENCSNLDSLTFKEVRRFELPLDSVSAISNNIVQLFSRDNNNLLVVSNFDNMRIDLFNLNNQSHVKSVVLQREGPFGIGQKPSGYHYHNKDSIFLFFNTNQRVFVINENGEIIDKTGALSKPDTDLPLIDIRGDMPSFWRNGNLHFSTYGLAYSEKAGAVLNLKSRDITYPYSLPESYSKGWFAGVVHDKYMNDYNESADLIIQSFGNDSNIYTVDRENNKKTYCAMSKYIPHEIKPYVKTKKDYAQSEQFLYRNEALQGSYSSVRFDPWQEMYYRTVFRPVKEESFHNPLQIWEKISIILLDKNFRVLGEFDLPPGLEFSKSFISKEGISFFDREQYKKNEDKMVFRTFNVVPK